MNHALARDTTILSVWPIFLFDVEYVVVKKVVRQRVGSLFTFSATDFHGYVGLAKEARPLFAVALLVNGAEDSMLARVPPTRLF